MGTDGACGLLFCARGSCLSQVLYRCAQADNQVPVTNNYRLVCRVFFSCCDSALSPQVAVWAPAWAPQSLTCDRSCGL